MIMIIVSHDDVRFSACVVGVGVGASVAEGMNIEVVVLIRGMVVVLEG